MAKGRKTGGRSRGTPNKMTADERAKVREAFAAIQGKAGVGLSEWAALNPSEFYTRIWARLLPKPVEVTGENGQPLTLTVRFAYE
jgi:hypothetical protein